MCQWKPARGFLWHMGPSAPSDSFIKLSNMNQITKLCILFYYFPVFPYAWIHGKVWFTYSHLISVKKKKLTPSVGPVDSLTPGQCCSYAGVLAISRKMRTSGNRPWGWRPRWSSHSSSYPVLSPGGLQFRVLLGTGAFSKRTSSWFWKCLLEFLKEWKDNQTP